MSRVMQLRAVIEPAYQPDFPSAYPKLARHLGYLKPDLVARQPTLYELASQLDKLLYEFDGTPLRTALLPYRTRILSLQKAIAQHLADWQLAKADALLYQLEDIFDDLELQLS